MINVDKVAEEADVIIQGYAISKCKEGVRIINLNNEKGAAVMMQDEAP